MSEISELAALAGALAWPILVGVLLIVYRKGIQKFLEQLIPRLTGFSAGPFSIELGEAKAIEPELEVGAFDPQGTHISGFTSAAPDLLQQVAEGPPFDYMTINLAEGNNWLVSRLYLFTAILQRTRGLRCVVFVDSGNGVRNRLVGFADSNVVCRALIGIHPWLETAFATVSENSLKYKYPGQSASSMYTQIVLEYLKAIEAPIAPVDAPDWVPLLVGTWEHSKWLNSITIEQILGEYLEQSYVQKTDLLMMTKVNQARLVLSMKGTFVAVVNQDKRFDSLIDRQELAEKVVRDIISK